jgi:DNA-directed RNA polymerase specialized sigma24 family protein
MRTSKLWKGMTEVAKEPEIARTTSLDRIIAHHSKFLGFLRAHVEDTGTAEDILQTAYIKAIEHGPEIRDEESTVA